MGKKEGFSKDKLPFPFFLTLRLVRVSLDWHKCIDGDGFPTDTKPRSAEEEELLSRKRGKRDRKGVGSISKMWATLRIF